MVFWMKLHAMPTLPTRDWALVPRIGTLASLVLLVAAQTLLSMLSASMLPLMRESPFISMNWPNLTLMVVLPSYLLITTLLTIVLWLPTLILIPELSLRHAIAPLLLSPRRLLLRSALCRKLRLTLIRRKWTALLRRR
jgi:hypothetical protein